LENERNQGCKPVTVTAVWHQSPKGETPSARSSLWGKWGSGVCRRGGGTRPRCTCGKHKRRATTRTLVRRLGTEKNKTPGPGENRTGNHLCQTTKTPSEEFARKGKTPKTKNHREKREAEKTLTWGPKATKLDRRLHSNSGGGPQPLNGGKKTLNKG